ncbi:MAG: hypothetical protein QXN16_01575 [Candidatus Micrarchaeaceae archaeon]
MDCYLLYTYKSILCHVENSQNQTKKVSIVNNNLEDVIKVIYQVRCNLFHGRKNPNDINNRDFRLINASYKLLLELMLQYLINQYFVELRTSATEGISNGVNAELVNEGKNLHLTEIERLKKLYQKTKRRILDKFIP